MWYAAKVGDLQEVRRLVEEEGVDPKEEVQADILDLTPLHWSAGDGHLQVVRYLIEEQHCDPMCVDADGWTPLHHSAHGGHLQVVRYLIEEQHCDPKCVDKGGRTPLHRSAADGHLQVVRYLIEEQHCDPKCVDWDGWTPLRHSAAGGHLQVVRYLIEEQHCDPKCVDEDGWTPLRHSAAGGHLQVVRYLIEEQHCDPKCVDEGRWTPLHRSADRGHLQVVRYLIEEQHCDPKCVDEDRWTLLHYSATGGHLQVVRYLIEEQHCDPKCVDKVGWTLLHHASSRWGNEEVVKYLLVVHHCDPNCKDKYGVTPLDLAVYHPAVARELIKAGAKSTSKPPQPPVKIFIVGNPSAGKSSLTKALQTETSALGAALASITGPRLVSDVEQKTAGIVPCQFTSRKYGHVTFYDFAGQQEYYASHAALLQNSISSSAPLFIIVVNLCDSEEDIKQKLVYWISFLANQCTSVTTKPHVIIVGSHSDVVRSRGEDPRAKVNMEFLQAAHVSSGFHISKFIPMDCRQSNSRDIFKLTDAMKESCYNLRKQFAVVYHLHQILTFLVEKFSGVSVVRFEQVLDAIEKSEQTTRNAMAFSRADDLNSDLCELNDRGNIMHLKGWIILDQAALLSEVNGVLFAPEDFKQHCNLANATGVVPVSKLAQMFPQHNLDMLVQFLSHLEFCREIHDREVLQLLCPEEHLPPTENTNERFLFFSGLVSLKAPSVVWETNPQFPKLCGWMLQCFKAGQFLTSQFIQVLLLRIAFFCALAPDTPGSSDLPVLQRKCSIWKNGIYWGSREGVQVLAEIRDPPQNKEVVVMLRCWSGQEVECARLHSTIIQMVLGAKEKLCPKVPTKEFLLHPSQVREYPLKSPAEQDLISIREVSRAVVAGSRGVVSSNNEPVDLKELLLVEPYANLKADILRQLFIGETKKVVSDRFFYEVAEHIYDKKDLFIDMLKLSRAQLADKIRQALGGDIEEFVCVLQCWRGDSGTYQSLRETLDQFSVFAGRNPLVSCMSCY